MATLTTSAFTVAITYGEVEHVELDLAAGVEGRVVMTAHMRTGEKHTAMFPNESSASAFMMGHKSRFRRSTINWLGTKLQ